MSNPYKGLQGSVQSPYAGLFFTDDINASHYLPIEYKKGMAHHYDWITVPEDSTTINDQTKSRFRIHRDYHLLGRCHLMWNQAPITGGGGGGGLFTCFLDYFPMLSVDHYVIKSDKAVQRDIIVPGIVHIQQFFEFTGPYQKDLDRINKWCLGGLSTADRNILATGDQQPRLPLEHILYWSRQESKYLPLSQLENDLIIEVFWNPLAQITQYDGVNPIQSLKTSRTLRCEVFTVLPEVLDTIGMITKTDGIISYYRDYVLNTYYIDENNNRSNNQDAWALDLEPFNCDVIYFCVLIRKTNEVESQPTNQGFSNLLPWSSYQFRTQTQIFQGPILYDESVYLYNTEKLDFPMPWNILFHYNEDNGLDDDNSMSGSKNYRAYNKPVLEIFPDPAIQAYINEDIGNTIRIDVIAACHNFVTLKNRTVSDNTIEFRKLFDF